MDFSTVKRTPSDNNQQAEVQHVEKRKIASPEERQAALNIALAVDPGVRSGSWRAFQFYLIALCACGCSVDSGFEGTVMGGVNSMMQYQHYFGMTGAGTKTGIVFGIFTIGSLVYVVRCFYLDEYILNITTTVVAPCQHVTSRFFSAGGNPNDLYTTAYLLDKFGRRASMFTGNSILIVGAAVTATAKNRSIFIGGRFLTGLGSTLAGASAKSYLAELTPPQSRGLFLGILNSFYYVGQMTATGMMVSTGKYAATGHGACLYSFRTLVGLSIALPHSSGPIPCMDGHSYGIIRPAVWQWPYHLFPLLLKNAGITSQNKQLTLNFVNSVTSFLGALAGSASADHIGRRRILLMSTGCCVVTLAIVTGRLSDAGHSSSTRSNAGIAWIYIFMVLFSYGYTPMSASIVWYQSLELRSSRERFGLPESRNPGLFLYKHIRRESLGKSTSSFWSGTFSSSSLSTLVETKGLTLEEIDEVFHRPRKYSTSHQFRRVAIPGNEADDHATPDKAAEVIPAPLSASAIDHSIMNRNEHVPMDSSQLAASSRREDVLSSTAANGTISPEGGSRRNADCTREPRRAPQFTHNPLCALGQAGDDTKKTFYQFHQRPIFCGTHVLRLSTQDAATNGHHRCSTGSGSGSSSWGHHRKGLSIDKMGFGKIFGSGSEQTHMTNGMGSCQVSESSTGDPPSSTQSKMSSASRRPSTLQVPPSMMSHTDTTHTSFMSPTATEATASDKSRCNTLMAMVEPFN
ncbi:hypothetical protein EW146_g3745 [Bondarzewia mesenterica]|uniref:Major facilitator superfamily (MFS) profile domain-containing protein n=1 Tax=Bondarzewia mesenterica TaxID=1095465 RepID=A0A4S4M2E5_9AGAM|nr:hypothetical protein EW146_g3745 [Bondarzewia mesenterica]